MSQKVTAHWIQDYTFTGVTDSHKSVVMDAATEENGKTVAPTPMDMILLGLAGCAGIDVKLILGKSKKTLHQLKVTATGQRRNDHPRIFTAIHLNFTVAGENLDDKTVKRAVELSATKYCSVSAMLEKSVKITHDYVIL